MFFFRTIYVLFFYQFVFTDGCIIRNRNCLPLAITWINPGFHWWGYILLNIWVFCIVFCFCLYSFCILCPMMPLNCVFFIVPSVSSNSYVYSNEGVTFKYRSWSAEVHTQRAIQYCIWNSAGFLLCSFCVSILQLMRQFSAIQMAYAILILLTIFFRWKECNNLIWLVNDLQIPTTINIIVKYKYLFL